MTRPIVRLVFLTCIGPLSGCAGKLLVFDHQGAAVKGMPFRSAEMYVKQGSYSKLAKGGLCLASPFVETVTMPTGALYFVTAESSSFAKTAFHIKYSDTGAVAEVGLDSEPAAAETLKAVGELYKAFVPAAAPAAAALAQPSGAPACDAGEVNVTFTRLDDYMKSTTRR